MVDDILGIQKCSDKSIELISAINAFIELRKLSLSSKKCSKIHIGKANNLYPDLKIHNAKMEESEQDKYLGDKMNKTGRTNALLKTAKPKDMA